MLKVYNRKKELLAYLENPYRVSYELIANGVSYLYFTLPLRDPKNEYCQAGNIIEVYDNNNFVDTFRISERKEYLIEGRDYEVEYVCEHVISTLVDTVLFGKTKINGREFNTKETLQTLLAKQVEEYWVLGECDFENKFSYNFEHENLLSAIYQIPKVLKKNYIWKFDTKSFPFVLSLKEIDPNFKADIRYKKNMTGVYRDLDSSNIITRIYGLGKGEGNNQITISDINNGKPYIEKNTDKYGIRESILIDRRFDNEYSLLAYMENQLDQLANPYISYTVNVLDLYSVDRVKYEQIIVGDLVRVVDRDLDLSTRLPVKSIRKSFDENIYEVVLENYERNIAGTISDLSNRVNAESLYERGGINVNDYSKNGKDDVTLVLAIPKYYERVTGVILSISHYREEIDDTELVVKVNDKNIEYNKEEDGKNILELIDLDNLNEIRVIGKGDISIDISVIGFISNNYL